MIMEMKYQDYKDEIKEYCLLNKLDFEKINSYPKCWNSEFIAVQYSDGDYTNTGGLLNDTPMPLVLLINKEENGISFEQTEYTKQYAALE
jgi:hypothetical protein